MAFTSVEFLLFLPVVWLVFYLVSDRARWFVLLAASFLFYASLNMPHLLIILALVTVAAYGVGIWLDGAKSQRAKGALLWSGVAVSLLILVAAKYLSFLSHGLAEFLSLFHLNLPLQPLSVVAAIGVSYYVFQAISYIIDIYLEVAKPERHLGYFALYLALFPKLVQGPIERGGDLIPQLRAKYEFNYDNMRSGLVLFMWGLFKKVVIADRAGLFANSVYEDVYAHQGLPLLIATYFYAIQIYMDFSGYTDMAIGCARLFNINLSQNFNSPYTAPSIAEFWRRWHMSFSRWILDYIFKPLQIQWRSWKRWGTPFALVITFLVVGIWHGASWGFVIWGVLHGLFMAGSLFLRPIQKKLHRFFGLEKTTSLRVLQVVITFHLVCFAWIFFRANHVADAWYVVTHFLQLRITGPMQSSLKDFVARNVLLGQSGRDLLIALGALIVVATVGHVARRKGIVSIAEFLRTQPVAVRWGLYYTLVISVLVLAAYESTTFIYYQF